jgi:hypothetical protein
MVVVSSQYLALELIATFLTGLRQSRIYWYFQTIKAVIPKFIFSASTIIAVP